MGDFSSHIKLAKEKAEAALDEYGKRRYSAAADLAYKACEQAVQAELAQIGSTGVHYRDHYEVRAWVKQHYPKEIADRFEDLYRLYIDVGYSGKTPVCTPERAVNHMRAILQHIGVKLNVDFGVK
ncbi:MAG: HEPN domain-containing protein [Candidatus Bathyarchaeota archaeon]|nr:HEPN domain-containing protein [Candidatus Bathyarchaeota archaeon]